MRKWILMAAALITTGCPQPRVVTVTPSANPAKVHSGETSTVTATATINQGTAPVAPGNMDFSAFLGAITPSPVTTDNTGTASSTFTAPVVDRETVVTITAEYGSASETMTVTVNPPIIACQFPDPVGGPPDPTDIVTISPEVRQQANGSWQWVYAFAIGSGHAGGIRSVSVTFQKAVTLKSSSGTVTPASGSNTNFVVSSPVAPFTITATADAEPGGTASWDVIDNPPTIRHARCTSTGPKP